MINGTVQPTRLLLVALGLAFIWPLSACGVYRPLSLDSTASASDDVRLQAVQLNVADKPDASRRFGEALANAFVRQGVRKSDDASLVVDYGLAQSAASTVIREKPRDDTGVVPVRSVVVARKSSPFDKCPAQRLKATLGLIDRATGIIRYRGEATIVDCAFSEDDEQALTDALVADAVSQFEI